MTETTHTPGPWTVEDEFEVVADGGVAICTVKQLSDFPCLDPDCIDLAALQREFAANAALIAAAPALLKALEEITVACEADFGVPGEDDGDDEAVGAGLDSEMAVTFGMIRRARAAIDGAS